MRWWRAPCNSGMSTPHARGVYMCTRNKEGGDGADIQVANALRMVRATCCGHAGCVCTASVHTNVAGAGETGTHNVSVARTNTPSITQD